MLFNSLQYLVFLPTVFLLFWLVPHRLRVPLLLVASYIFYMSWRPLYGFLILGLTVANFLLIPRIAGCEAVKQKKIWLGLVVAVNLITLGIFKYAYFGMDCFKTGLNIVHLNWHEPHLHILLPLGISFFVFEFIHYAVEVYRGKPLVSKFFDFALFASFFPTQIAGPIKRYQDFIPQLAIPAKFKWEYVDQGMQLILMGLCKKVLLADNLSLVVQAGFTHPEKFSSLDMWLITYTFAFQIFFDFAGYTDIARGSALLFGYKVPINFNLPYLAANAADFWHRWHISLSSWLRDYLYIPLGGSRGNLGFLYRNLFITMALGGLWHGAANHFLLWGVYQGVLLIAHREYVRFMQAIGWHDTLLKSRLYHWFSVTVTFQFVCLGWVLFRADSEQIAWQITCKLAQAPMALLNFSSAQLTILQIRDPIIFPAIVLLIPALLISHVVVNWLNNKKFYLSPPWPVQVATMVAMLCLLTIFSPDTSPKFIYFQF